MTFKYTIGAPGMGPSPNSVLRADDFHISYNDTDWGIYGSDTTAIVVGQMERFYLLNGDHRLAFAELVPEGLDACLDYFRENIAQMNFRSENPDEPAPTFRL